MKNFLFKISLVFLIAFGTYTLITVTEKQQADAVCVCNDGCFNPGLCMCPWDSDTIESVANFGASWAAKAEQMFESAQQYMETYMEAKETEAEANEEMLTALAAEELSANVEKLRNEANRQTATNAIKKTTNYQRNQYEDIVDSPAPSEQVCFHTTVRQEEARTEAAQEHARRERYTKKRQRRGAFPKTVKTAVLVQEAKNDQDLIKKAAELRACNGCTLSPDDQRVVDVVDSIITDDLDIPPRSEADLEDNPTQIIEDVKQVTRNSLIDAVAARIETTRQSPGSVGCAQSQEIVYTVSASVYGNPFHKLPPGVCPSAETLRWAEVTKLRNSSDMEAALSDMTGNARAQQLHVSILNLFMDHDQYTLKQLELTQEVARNLD